jgi:hypothetical protein
LLFAYSGFVPFPYYLCTTQKWANLLFYLLFLLIVRLLETPKSTFFDARGLGSARPDQGQESTVAL